MRDEFYIQRQGKRYCLYAGLIDELHTKYDRDQHRLTIDTNLIQIPSAENGNVAIVKAVIEILNYDGGLIGRYGGLGDASPENVGKNIAPHIIRMAETRAKARALRDCLNIAAAALEELSDGEESRTSSQERSQGQEGASPTPISQGRQTRSRDDELTPGGVPVGRANELIALLIKAGNKREEVGPYVWNAKPEAVEKKMNELKGRESG